MSVVYFVAREAKQTQTNKKKEILRSDIDSQVTTDTE